MCANYVPVTSRDRMLTFFGVDLAVGSEGPAVDVFPLGLAPFIRKAVDGSGNRQVEVGMFGLLPGFAKEVAYGRKTYNARAETVHQLASFRSAWAKGQRCIVPAEALFEYCYETGESERWCIAQPASYPFGVAGVFGSWNKPDGTETLTFAMLTINAEGHPVYERMHAPGEEKRMPAILDPQDFDAWLGCGVADAKAYLRQWRGPLETWRVGPPARKKKEPKPPAPPRAPNPQQGLF
jgi:putative SOS response-associated peptidase YedK